MTDRNIGRSGSPGRAITSALVVEDCPRLGPLLRDVVSLLAAEVALTGSKAEACEVIRTLKPEIVLLDLYLRDSTGLEVLREIQTLDSVPAVVVLSSTRDPVLAFKAAEAGARVFLPKPLNVGELHDAIKRALNEAPDLTPLLRTCVGRVPVRDLEHRVREVMVREALARSEGNRRGAARMLSISRQLLQHVLRALDDCA